MKPTAFTRRMGIQHPLVLAPMAGGPSTPALCAAVSEAGAFGSLAGAYLEPAKLREEIRAVRAATSRPFAVNLFADEGVAADERTLRAAQDATARYRAELGLPPPGRPRRASRCGKHSPCCSRSACPCSASSSASRPRDAGVLPEGRHPHHGHCDHGGGGAPLEQAGVDFICAQGAEAGGHRGTFDRDADPPLIGTMALVPQIAGVASVPVIAAAGSWTGAGSPRRWRSAPPRSRWDGLLALPGGGHQRSVPRRAARSARRLHRDHPRLLRAPGRGLANRFTREMAGAPWRPSPSRTC